MSFTCRGEAMVVVTGLGVVGYRRLSKAIGEAVVRPSARFVRGAQGGPGVMALCVRTGTAGLSLLFILVWRVTTGFSSPSRCSGSGLAAGIWHSGGITSWEHATEACNNAVNCALKYTATEWCYRYGGDMASTTTFRSTS
eukprot:scaffold38856_cov60-Phaeocystis_antarctica.AAC.6